MCFGSTFEIICVIIFIYYEQSEISELIQNIEMCWCNLRKKCNYYTIFWYYFWKIKYPYCSSIDSNVFWIGMAKSLWVITEGSFFGNNIHYSNWKINFYLRSSIASDSMFLWRILNDLPIFSHSWNDRALFCIKLARHLNEHNSILNLLFYHGTGGFQTNGGFQTTKCFK